MNTRQFKETFLEYAKTGIRPTIYKNQVSKFVREYHHLTPEEFLEFRKEFVLECESDTSINHWHQYLPANFQNDFYNLIEEIKKAEQEIQFENVIIEGLFIVDKFLNKYIEMFKNPSATVQSINAQIKKRDQGIVYAAAQHYTDFQKTIEENLNFIKKKYLSYSRSEHDDFLRNTIRDLFVFKKLSLIDQKEKEDLIEKGVAETLKPSYNDLVFGNYN